VDVRRRGDGVGADSRRSYRAPLGDVLALGNRRAAQLEERDGVAVGGVDGDGAAAAGDRADERHLTGRGREDNAPDRRGDVDAAMLAAGVDVRAERKGPQHLAGHGPCPGRGGRRDGQRRQDDRDNESSPHR
jgi:hypothetical protein